MATVVKTFNYTGTLQQVTVPAGTTSIDVHLWGGAGGGGGSDAGGPGGTGAAGHYVTETGITIASSDIGKTLEIAVGGGGAGGSSGGGAPGGTNGKSITGYSGGKGGNAGPQPYSGSGGDNGGTGGYSGSNYTAAGTESNGSGVTPGGTGSQYYTSGVARGGNPSRSGADGKAVVIFNIGVQANYKVSGTWKNINDMYTKVSGAWKRITAGYYKVGGVWKALFNSGVNFIETAAGFGDATGGSSSGTPGSGGGCFIAGTMITMADGTQKPVEQVDIRDEVAVGGFVFATGKFLIDNLYDYKGIKVSGTHMVKEDGKWTRVEDSEHGVALGDDEHIVYVFGSEHRRIIIDGTEFTDYFELSEQKELINHGEGIFSNWRDHDRQIHGKNVNILNA
jgi:hypothetical protein